MSNVPPADLLTPLGEPSQDLQPGPSQTPTQPAETGMVGGLPAIPRPSRRRTPNPPLPPGEPQGPRQDAEERPGAADTTGSSEASTEPPAQPGKRLGRPGRPKRAPGPVPVEKIEEALVVGADMAFVGVGQGMGWMLDRTRRRQHDPDRWTPTVEERQQVLYPLSRIVSRHIYTDTAAADTVDGLLAGAGLGQYALRTIAGHRPLPAVPPLHKAAPTASEGTAP